jgi:type II secretory pathway pseudopilin PulG
VSLRQNKSGFTLVEVVLALGILVFAGFALISLMAEGFQSSKDSKQQFQAATIAEYICATRRTAPTTDLSTTQPNFPLPNLTNAVPTGNTNNFGYPVYMTADGATTTQANARFGLLFSINAPTTYVPAVSPGAATVYLYIYWPPQMSATSATNGSTSHYELTTSIAMP